jgi:hypothetical protein
VNTDADSGQAREETSSTVQADTTEVPEVRTLKAELAAEKERFLRLAADFDNFRKRIAQESERRAAVQKKAFILELLPILDNLERALGSGQSTFTESLPPSPRRRFAVARPSYCGRAVARRAKVAFGLWRTGRDKSSAYNPKLLKLALMGRSPSLP